MFRTYKVPSEYANNNECMSILNCYGHIHRPRRQFTSIVNRTPEQTCILKDQNSTYKELLRLTSLQKHCILFIDFEWFTSVNKNFLFIQNIFLEKCHGPLKCMLSVPFSKQLISNNKVQFFTPLLSVTFLHLLRVKMFPCPADCKAILGGDVHTHPASNVILTGKVVVLNVETLALFS